jgi:hypothetical protein
MDAYFQWLKEKRLGGRPAVDQGSVPPPAAGLRWFPASPADNHLEAGGGRLGFDPRAIGFFCCCLSIL